MRCSLASLVGNEQIFPYNSGENVEEAITWLRRAFSLSVSSVCLT